MHHSTKIVLKEKAQAQDVSIAIAAKNGMLR
jgi:hypothetical protein